MPKIKPSVPDPNMKPEERSYAELEYPSAPILPSPGRPTLMWGTYMNNDNKGRPQEDAYLLPNLVAGMLWDFEGWRRTGAGQQYIRRISDESAARACETVPSTPKRQRVVAQAAVKPLLKAKRRLQKHAAAKKTTQTRKSKT